VRFLKNKIFNGIVFVAAVALVFGIISSFKDNPVSNALNTIASPFQSLFSSISRPVAEHFDAVDKMREYESENKRLLKENVKLKIENRTTEDYINENNRLKKLLDLRDKQVNMETTAAQVIGRDIEKWCKSVTINKGTSSGIKAGDPVMTTEGILGVVDTVGINWAKVTTIFDSESSVGAKFTRNGDVGVVEGSNELAPEGKCKMQYISGTASVIIGDILVTSGLGEVYPSGLMIGNIDNINIDAMGNVEYVTVKPAVDFEKVYEVLVITKYEENTEETEEAEETTEDSKTDDKVKEDKSENGEEEDE